MLKTFIAVSILSLIAGQDIVNAQEHVLEGRVRDLVTRLPVSGISVSYSDGLTITGADGKFKLRIIGDSITLNCSGIGYEPGDFPIQLTTVQDFDLGDLWIQPLSFRDTDAEEYLIALEDADEENPIDAGMPLLKGTRDVFLSRAAFDFSAGFYRIRGQDSRESTLIFNGLLMNRCYDGRPAWSNWAGLSDISRNMAQTSGWDFSGTAFGGLSGVTDISAAPSLLRKGTKITTSLANKSYAFRSMLTYNSGIGNRGIGYLISFTSRLGTCGYIDGTPFKGYSGFAAFQWEPNRQNSFTLSGMLSYSRRGVAGPFTDELMALA